ncbi:MAG: hypothetical protein QOF18_2860 [Frankiaceae bacterium]|jgi:hypothetical protein|nr:hypothetical protein [Frankiaceae bacterium]
MLTTLFAVLGRAIHRLAVERRSQRGDVPGWVLITLMTAGIVTALWIVAEPKLSSLLSNALNISGDPNGK